jgi:hypothetical protein
MDQDRSITAAARHRDWDSCARIMFQQLFFCTTEEQRIIVVKALSAYGRIWNEKHPKLMLADIDELRQELPSFPDDLDPADTEFQNSVFEYRAGLSLKIDHAERTSHFATAIRSSVLAIQINRWILGFPDQYKRWRAGRIDSGPTFLDDKTAASDAENAWIRIDGLFARQPSRDANIRMRHIPNEIEEAYFNWERSLL